MIYLYLALVVIVGYLLGNINFARIFSWRIANKDITEVGSKNPGTMNVLRTRGLGEAMLTLTFEALKSGVPALACYFLFEHYFVGFGNLAYFLSAFGAVLGHCFPVFYKFKGGKGVACTFGMFLFHPNFWWLTLALFALGFIMIFFIDYPFIVTMSYVFAITIYSTCFFAINLTMWYIPLIVIVWLNCLLLTFMHRGNIKRLINGTENKVHFKDKVFKKKKTEDKKVEETQNEMQTVFEDKNYIDEHKSVPKELKQREGKKEN